MSKILLSKMATRAPKGLSKEETKEKTSKILDQLSELQNLMYAENQHALLIIIQGMDGSGKDGLIKDVFTSMNPQGINVKSWKAPTPDEAAHDFLWRIHHHTPAKGMIQIHNRSHYEDVIITRVHRWINAQTASERFAAINHFESLLSNANTTILKFYLHISHTEQLERLNERMSAPEKMWKYNENDLKESALWDTYMKYYNEAFQKCNQIPWHIIPSDQNWYKNYIVAKTILDTLINFKMKFPGLKK